jgi:sugar/nucleoside kinase (ribokinase family)
VKRLGVLGTFVWDRIWRVGTAPDRPVEQLGGLAYSMSAFAAVCPTGWSIVPIARVGVDLAPEVMHFLGALPNISSETGLTLVHEPNNRVDLHYRSHAERTERLSGGVTGWQSDEMRRVASGLDALYVNFLAGNEIELATAELLRLEFSIPVYADLHSLFLGTADDGPRPPRRLPDAPRWVAAFDAIQVNETELGLLAPEGSPPLSLLRELPEMGPLLAVVTRGEVGAAYACRLPLSAPEQWPAGRGGHLEPIQVQTGGLATPHPISGGDPTGCGDVWGSVLFASMLDGLDLGTAMDRAHLAAAAKIRHGAIDGLAPAIREATSG